MTRVIVLVLFTFLAFAVSLSGDLPTAAHAQQRETTATVTRVVDGDTIEISPALGGNEEVRLIGVDTPETVDPAEGVEPYGPQASSFAKAQLEGERVRLEFDQEREDQFGRLLAYVRLGSQVFNETLLRQGYAQLYVVPPNDRYEARFRAAQQQARSAERGLWGLSQDQLCRLADRGNGIGEGSPGCVGGDGEPSASDEGAGENQYADREDDVIPGTFRKRTLADTGGPPVLLIVPWLAALFAVAGVALLRRS